LELPDALTDHAGGLAVPVHTLPSGLLRIKYPRGEVFMETNSIYTIIDVIIAFGGLYIIYLTYGMMKTGQLKENALLPKGTDIRKCKDAAGYIKYMAPKQIVFGVMALACGAIGIVHDYLGAINSYVYLACILVMVLYLVYYSIQSKKAMKQYW
jgi:threonine/homoserine/homoserine lactone efflux protein